MSVAVISVFIVVKFSHFKSEPNLQANVIPEILLFSLFSFYLRFWFLKKKKINLMDWTEAIDSVAKWWLILVVPWFSISYIHWFAFVVPSVTAYFCFLFLFSFFSLSLCLVRLNKIEVTQTMSNVGEQAQQERAHLINAMHSFRLMRFHRIETIFRFSSCTVFGLRVTHSISVSVSLRSSKRIEPRKAFEMCGICVCLLCSNLI